MNVSRQDLERRIATAERWYRACRICPHACGVDRMAGQLGRCRVGADARWYRELIHHGEELELGPLFVIYLSGCALRCGHCSDGAWVSEPTRRGTWPLRADDMAQRLAIRRREGARGVEFVGGDPSVNLLAALRLLRDLPEELIADLPVVWNTSLWMAPEALALLDDVVDVYLADLKHGPGPCERLTGVPDYWSVVTANLLQALEQTNAQTGAREGHVLVRHLVLPGHVECCTEPALRWLREHVPDAVPNLMTGYVPFDRMEAAPTPPPSAPRSDRALTPTERAEATALLRALDFPRALLDGRPL